MYQPLIKFHPHPAIITQVLCIFVLLEQLHFMQLLDVFHDTPCYCLIVTSCFPLLKGVRFLPSTT